MSPTLVQAPLERLLAPLLLLESLRWSLLL